MRNTWPIKPLQLACNSNKKNPLRLAQIVLFCFSSDSFSKLGLPTTKDKNNYPDMLTASTPNLP